MGLFTSDPVGEVKLLPELQIKIESLAKTWLDNLPVKASSWFSARKANMIQISKYLMFCLDELIQIVEGLIDSGPDKKATVLNSISALYDYIIAEGLPIYLRPFAGVVKNFVINTLISSAIDFLVSKYKDGSWKALPDAGTNSQDIVNYK